MEMVRLPMALGLIGLALPAATAAQTAPPACAAPVMAEGVLAPWNNPAKFTAGPLTPGQAARVALKPAFAVDFVVPPGRKSDDPSFGAVYTLTITEPGTYRVALATAGWIDVAGKDGVIASTAHGHGPECTGIRKMVDFPLTPGAYSVQIAANPVRHTTLLVVRLP
jgi:hypothetical protein